ncbi:MAG: amino acid ABC transporter permease [Actinomycetota bacterium]|nr:amino acid ABC transporter permease [Actinomycetota bacterium]HSH23607.1 amino acid ABC transporter permease [Acidimicrobiales bacterium]
MDRLAEEFFDLDVIADLFPGLVTEAVKNTVVFTLLGFAGGMMFGLILALMRISRSRWLRWPSAFVVDTFRGLPALLVIVFIGFGLPIAFPGLRYPFPKYTPGVLALSIVAGAYIAETLRAGIQGVPRGQMEAARSLGMTHRDAMRRVVLPQAFRLVVPPLTNELALLFKDTSLLAVLGTEVGGKEILKYVRDAVNRTGDTSPLVAGGLAYLVITIPLIRAVTLLEARTRTAR